MALHKPFPSLVLFFLTAANAQQSAYAQCGGTGWTGLTTCVSGYVCTVSSSYYSQCIPGTASISTVIPSVSSTTSSAAPSTTVLNATSTSTGTPTTTGIATTTVSGGGSGPGSSLQSNYSWIRAVESPNFHSYLQTSPTYVPGIALMDSYTSAGQFQIVDGQLVELIDGGLLYLNVETQANSSVTKLAVTFETTENTYGTFAFSGDAVQWSVASISRPNLSAWLVCEGQQLFINLGAYDYLTPAGCADETIHYYNGATAVD